MWFHQFSQQAADTVLPAVSTWKKPSSSMAYSKEGCWASNGSVDATLGEGMATILCLSRFLDFPFLRLESPWPILQLRQEYLRVDPYSVAWIAQSPLELLWRIPKQSVTRTPEWKISQKATRPVVWICTSSKGWAVAGRSRNSQPPRRSALGILPVQGF